MSPMVETFIKMYKKIYHFDSPDLFHSESYFSITMVLFGIGIGFKFKRLIQKYNSPVPVLRQTLEYHLKS